MHPTTTCATRRRLSWTAMAVGLVLLFTAAGCGATVDTVLTLNTDGSGVRKFTATVLKDDLAKVVGGATAVDALVKQNKPAELSYGGVTTNAAGTAVFSFSVEFADSKQYQTKIIAILGAGGVVKDGDLLVMGTYGSPFKTGTEVQENFSSLDLLAWLTNAMIDAGQVQESDRGQVLTTGTNSIVIGGVPHQVYGNIDYSNVQSFSLRGLRVTTDGVGTATLTRTIVFDLAPEAYAHDPKGFDDFFTKATPSGGKLTKPASGESLWTMTFSASTPADLAKATNQALSSQATEFSVTSEADSQSPLMVTTTVTDKVECPAICAQDARVQSMVVVPTGWQTERAQPVDGKQVIDTTGGQPVTLSRSASVGLVSIKAQLARGSTNTAIVALSLPAADDALIGTGFKAAIAAHAGGRPIAVAKGAGTVTYSVSLTADSPQALSTAIDQLLADEHKSGVASLWINEGDSSMSKKSIAVGALFDLSRSWVAAWKPTKGATYSVTLPTGPTLDTTSQLPTGATVSGNVVTFSTSKLQAVSMNAPMSQTNTRGIGLLAGGAALLLAIVVIVVVVASRMRRRA